jgi:ABC-type oligopeptide transport system substrate-binding subunit
MCTSLLQFDVSQPPLDDPDVRRALVLALDRAALNEQFSEGVALLATSVLPPAMPGFSPDLPRFEFDAQAARDALAASTYGDGELPTLVINQSGLGQEPSDFILAVANMWTEALGVEIEIEQLDPEDYSRAAREQHGHIVSYGWCADYPDPENFLDVLYHSDSNFNVAGFDNPQVDALLEAARSEPDVAVRLDLYRQAETIIVGDVAAIPLTHSVQHILVKPYVKNYVLVPIGALVIPQVTLDYEE